VDRQFVPIGERAPDVLEAAAVEEAPDVVLLPLGEFAFWAETVELRVRQLFGKRAARWFKTAERRFDRATSGRRGVRGSARAGAKWVARRTIGVSALATPKQVTETYRESFTRLARLENTVVVVVAYPETPLPALQKPRLRDARAAFIRDLRREAEMRHFSWMSGDEVIAAQGLTPTEAYAADHIHIGEAAHELFAEAILAQLAASGVARTGARS
jgi:hypothetical protein